jgi:hypothetical protein
MELPDVTSTSQDDAARPWPGTFAFVQPRLVRFGSISVALAGCYFATALASLDENRTYTPPTVRNRREASGAVRISINNAESLHG